MAAALRIGWQCTVNQRAIVSQWIEEKKKKETTE
jgi:hypothetical protein